MSSSAKTRFAELLGCARAALWDARVASAGAESRAVVRAVTAASRAAGFLEAVTINDPLAARDMVAEFESLVHMVENARDEMPRAEGTPS